MTWPGEALIIRLWDTLADKAVGGLLRPWQERRVGDAQNEVKAREIVLLARARAEADRIVKINSPTAPPKVPFVDLTTIDTNFPLQPKIENKYLQNDSELNEFDPEKISEIVERKDLANSIRREVNVAKAALIAEDVLARDHTALPSENVDVDWLSRWEEYAGQVSTDELLDMWGRILAREVSSPGSNSLRLMEFLKTVSLREAERIETVAPYAICGIVAREHLDVIKTERLSVNELLKLQEIGVISSVESTGIMMEFRSSSHEKFIKVLPYQGFAIVAEHEDSSKIISIYNIPITSIGMQLISLCTIEPDVEYLESIAKNIVRQGFKVRIGKWEQIGISSGNLTESRDIAAEVSN